MQSRQEDLWRGKFGDAYSNRNAITDDRLNALTEHWARILRSTKGAPPRSILEVGANIGLNLRALRRLSNAEFYAIEPNGKARDVLIEDHIVAKANVLDGVASAIGLPNDSVDFAFTSGVLIHIHPTNLAASCRELHRVTRRYLACIEYFSDREEEVRYRGETEALFKRDFGGFYLDQYPDLRVLDYGFTWKRLTGLDNVTWWLFEKQR